MNIPSNSLNLFGHYWRSGVLVMGVTSMALVGQISYAEQLYRWTDQDGNTHYSDQPPPASAKKTEQRSLGGNYIETSSPSYALQVAQQKNPVKLYAGACGEFCDNARVFLNRRGVPFAEIDPAQPSSMEELRKISGDSKVPVLKVGETIVSGYNEARWNTALDQAGYPKTPPAKVVEAVREEKRKKEMAAQRSQAEKAQAERDKLPLEKADRSKPIDELPQ